ncbi:MAG: ribbon-helix-helix domain-containing protein [Promethearchaeota archaeon]
MKMVKVSIPDEWLERMDDLISSNQYPNRAEAFRVAVLHFLDEQISLLEEARRTG